MEALCFSRRLFESYDIEQTNNRFVAIPNSEPKGFKVNNLLELA
jgi:hypothetical protein